VAAVDSKRSAPIPHAADSRLQAMNVKRLGRGARRACALAGVAHRMSRGHPGGNVTHVIAGRFLVKVSNADHVISMTHMTPIL
jgi:hypothetical protein